MKILAAIHDVTPALQDEVRALWAQCRAVDLTPALFVVPVWHGYARLEGAPGFLQWLRARADDGAEIFLHGYRHDEWESRRTLADHVRAIGRTDFEAEFLALTRTEARGRLQYGVDRLRAAGLTPVGFVPPAWLAPKWLAPLAAQLALPITEDDRHIVRHDAQGNAIYRIAAPALRWSGRSPWRAHASEGVARLRRVMHDADPLVRIALHPGDLRHAATTRSVATELRWWSARRDGTTYAAATVRPAITRAG